MKITTDVSIDTAKSLIERLRDSKELLIYYKAEDAMTSKLFENYKVMLCENGNTIQITIDEYNK